MKDFEQSPSGWYVSNKTGLPSSRLIESAKQFGLNTAVPWCVSPIFITTDHPEFPEETTFHRIPYDKKMVTSPAKAKFVFVSGKTGDVLNKSVPMRTVFMLRYDWRNVEPCRSLFMNEEGTER